MLDRDVDLPCHVNRSGTMSVREILALVKLKRYDCCFQRQQSQKRTKSDYRRCGLSLNSHAKLSLVSGQLDRCLTIQFTQTSQQYSVMLECAVGSKQTVQSAITCFKIKV